jgi:hypothetical protein
VWYDSCTFVYNRMCPVGGGRVDADSRTRIAVLLVDSIRSDCLLVPPIWCYYIRFLHQVGIERTM